MGAGCGNGSSVFRQYTPVLPRRDNWWNIYPVEAGSFSPIHSGIERTEIGGPGWAIGRDYYHLLDDDRILARVMRGGVSSLLMIDPASSWIS